MRAPYNRFYITIYIRMHTYFVYWAQSIYLCTLFLDSNLLNARKSQKYQRFTNNANLCTDLWNTFGKYKNTAQKRLTEWRRKQKSEREKKIWFYGYGINIQITWRLTLDYIAVGNKMYIFWWRVALAIYTWLWYSRKCFYTHTHTNTNSYLQFANAHII